MKFHHVAIFVSDADESLRLYRDLLGFSVQFDEEIPDGEAPGPGVTIYRRLIDEIWEHPGARSRVIFLISEHGARLELQQSLEPPVIRTDPEKLKYRHTGIHEVAFEVTDIDCWFEKVKSAGFRAQTEEVWEIRGVGRSFLFYDPDGNLVQLFEPAADA